VRVPLAILADYAVALPDGRLYVAGGGIRSLSFPVFPATQLRLALALGLEVPATEAGRPHTMSIEATGPTEDLIVKPVGVTFTVPPDPSDATELRYFHLVSNMENVAFSVEGNYSFAISIDDEVLEKIPLRVAKTSGELSAEQQAAVLVNEGYLAYMGGEPARAEKVFRDVLVRFPAHPGGHNNLGFVLLAKGEASGAIEEFEKAREFGYSQPEFNDANVACALYLLGDAAGALTTFQRCLHENLFRSGGMLFGIGEERLFHVLLQSASDYVSLMTLNAAWSAYRAKDLAAATRYSRAVTSAELAVRDDPSGKQFADSVRALEAQLARKSRPRP
jgi:tetratricopeptide (TPR) repeat protein